MQTAGAARTTTPAAIRVIGLTFLCLGGILLCVALGLAVKDALFVHHATRTYGRVVDFDEKNDDDGDTTYAPIFVFVDATGQEHGIHSSSSSNPAAFDVGDTIPILYNPSNPGSAKIDTFWQIWIAEFILGIIGLVQFVLGAALLWVAGRKSRGTAVGGFGTTSAA